MAREEDQEQSSQEQSSYEGGDAYTRTEVFIEKNKKPILGAIVIIVAIVAAYFGYQRLYLAPMDEDASAEMWKAEYYFGVDSLQKAIHGDQAGYKGFKDIVEEYGGTRSAGLARYYLAVSYLRSGRHQEAATQATSVETANAFVNALAQGVAGEAYVEMGKKEEALSYFKEAARISDNDLTRPLYLKKAGLLLESMQEYGKALELYERIRDEHPGSHPGQDIEKYIGRAEARS